MDAQDIKILNIIVFFRHFTLFDYERSVTEKKQAEHIGGCNIYRRNKSVLLATHSSKPSVDGTPHRGTWPYNNAKYA